MRGMRGNSKRGTNPSTNLRACPGDIDQQQHRDGFGLSLHDSCAHIPRVVKANSSTLRRCEQTSRNAFLRALGAPDRGRRQRQHCSNFESCRPCPPFVCFSLPAEERRDGKNISHHFCQPFPTKLHAVMICPQTKKTHLQKANLQNQVVRCTRHGITTTPPPSGDLCTIERITR